MRSFQFLFLLVFILIYTVISVGAVKNILKNIKQKLQKRFLWMFVIYCFLLLACFIFLYIYPMQMRHATNYSIYLIFNTILFIDFFIKIILGLSYSIYWFFRKRKNARIILICGIIISTSIGIILLNASVLGNRTLKVTRVELAYDNLPQEFNNFTIAHFSDIHLGSLMGSKALLKKTAKQLDIINPDLILFTGDLVNNFGKETVGFEDVFKDINVEGRSYSILGNHDYGDYTTWEDKNSKEQNFNKILSANKKFGFQLLRNENVPIVNGIDTIYLAGVENWGHPPFPQLANLDKAMENIPKDAFEILMTHDPAHWESQVKGKRKIELSLSGHTHGLQWGIKVAGIPFSLAYLVRQYWGGMYKWENSILYVNTGLGAVGIPWRIDMPAELTIFTLKRSKVD